MVGTVRGERVPIMGDVSHHHNLLRDNEMGDRSMALKYNFDADLLASQRCEQRFIRYLRQNGFKHIEQAPKTETFHDWDIKTENDSYEIKYDRHFKRTGNILIETTSCTKSMSNGWFTKTKANWLVVFYSETEFYVTPMQHLRDMFYTKASSWKRLLIDRGEYNTVCWLAPITVLTELRCGVIQ